MRCKRHACVYTDIAQTYVTQTLRSHWPKMTLYWVSECIVYTVIDITWYHPGLSSRMSSIFDICVKLKVFYMWRYQAKQVLRLEYYILSFLCDWCKHLYYYIFTKKKQQQLKMDVLFKRFALDLMYHKISISNIWLDLCDSNWVFGHLIYQ